MVSVTHVQTQTHGRPNRAYTIHSRPHAAATSQFRLLIILHSGDRSCVVRILMPQFGPGHASLLLHTVVSAQVPDDVPCIVVAHEFVDALPVHIFRKDEERGWVEVLVDEPPASPGPRVRCLLPASGLLVCCSESSASEYQMDA